MRKYSYAWTDWCCHGDTQGWPDYYMRTATRDEKVLQLMSFFKARYVSGLREKQATAAGSAVRKYFEVELETTEWFDDPRIRGARRACRRSPAENRVYARSKEAKDKKPIWYDLLGQIREDYWLGQDYDYKGIDNKMIAINVMFSYDLALRRGEANMGGEDDNDHSIKNEDLTFYLYEAISVDGVEVQSVRGGGAAFRQYVVSSNVESCMVKGISHKAGLIHAGKLIEQRTAEEAELLMDLVEWVLYSGSGPGEPVFSRYVQFPGRAKSYKKCIPKMITEVIKKYVREAGLDPVEFSIHSLRKGCVRQMNADGIEKEETNARGNYAKESIMVQTVYNSNDTGRGPLSSSTTGIGRRVGVKDVSRQMGAAYEK
jgi:hypothetical protein